MMMNQLDADLRVVLETTYAVKAFKEKMLSEMTTVLIELGT